MLNQYSEEPNFGFTILAPDYNYGLISSTARSIRNHYQNVPFICYVGKDTPAAEIKEIKEICPCYKGKDTITSLMNAAMKKHKQWNMFIMEGAIARANLDRKYNTFLQDENDVFFPIVVDHNRDGIPVNIRSTFYDASLNGLCIHAKTFKKVGELSDGSLEEAKLFWGAAATEKGVRFKAILGSKMI